jgi:hypothetical protein
MATLTKYTQCERLELRLKELTDAKAKALAEFPRNIEADFAKKRREAILKLDTEAAKMAVNNGIITITDLTEAQAAAKEKPSSESDPAQPASSATAKAR